MTISEFEVYDAEKVARLKKMHAKLRMRLGGLRSALKQGKKVKLSDIEECWNCCSDLYKEIYEL